MSRLSEPKAWVPIDGWEAVSSPLLGQLFGDGRRRRNLNCSVEEAWTLLFSKIDFREWYECWHWTGKVDAPRIVGGKARTLSYGRVWLFGKCRSAHRVAWEIANATRLERTEICCHLCDNPTCCNPRHIFIGTHSDNLLDCVYKGRWKNGGRRLRCQRGHALNPENVIVERSGAHRCKVCTDQYYAERSERDRAATAARRLICPPDLKRRVCKRGHPLSGDNLIMLGGAQAGQRRCKACAYEQNNARRRKIIPSDGAPSVAPSRAAVEVGRAGLSHPTTSEAR